MTTTVTVATTKEAGKTTSMVAMLATASYVAPGVPAEGSYPTTMDVTKTEIDDMEPTTSAKVLSPITVDKADMKEVET